MRELTKSIFSFSWAMSLFGIQQTTNLTAPQRAAQAFNAVTEATEEQFSDAIKSTFHAGDKLQQSAVDLTLGMIGGDVPNANQWVRTASDAAKQSTEVLSRAVEDVTATVRKAASNNAPQNARAGSAPGRDNAATASQRPGWGPVPS
jgi:hypothetical protein